MEKIQEMVAAMCDAATAYGAENGLTVNETITALAHTYVIFGFSVKKEDLSAEAMKDALVECVSASCDNMIEVSANAEKT